MGLNRDRNWTVLFIGGPSGTGKSSLAYAIAGFYGVNVLEADDVHQVIKEVTTPDAFPAIHHWESGIDWKTVDVSRNVAWLLDVGREMMPALMRLASRHIEDQLPVIIEGDFIHPELSSLCDNPQIKSVFVREADRDQILQNYLSREGGELQRYRADISIAYGDCLSAACARLGIAVIDSRPWDTALKRVIDSLEMKTETL